MRGLLTRIVTALVILPIALALIWVPGLEAGWAIFVLAMASIGLNEYTGLARRKGLQPERVAVMLAGAAVVVAGWLGGHTASCAALFAGMLAVAYLHVTGRGPSVSGIASDMFGIVYVGWFPAHVVMLHTTGETGSGLVMILIVAIVLSDVGAYFVGKGIGKRKLAPIVSPNKTWEGAIGGTVLAVVGCVGAHYVAVTWLPDAFPVWPVWQYAIAGLGLSVAGQIGDLLESSLKRDVGVKDAGTIFPGHGGVLDRFDGFLFAGPVLYYVAVLLA